MRPSIEQALRAAERGAALTHRLLAFSRQQMLVTRNVDFNRLIGDMDELLRRTLGEHVEIELKLAGDLWPALADSGQVENSLLNLAINARDAMPDGGKLTIETSNVHLDEDYAEQQRGSDARRLRHDDGDRHRHRHAGGCARARVRAVLHHQGGRQGHRPRPQHDLRLRQAIRRPREDLQRGRTWHHRPALSPAPCQSIDGLGLQPRPRAPRKGGGETILVVEDNPDVRRLVLRQLRDLGYEVIEAANGPQALQILDGGASIDLLFTDVVMPGGMTGRQLAEAAKTRRPDLKTLFTSGYTEDSILRLGKLDPGVRLLSKPYRKHELATRIRETLDG